MIELEEQVNLVPALLEAVNTFQSSHAIAEKALEVLQDYLQLDWTNPLLPDDLCILTNLATCSDSSEDMKRKSINCQLIQMEKGLQMDDYFLKFPVDKLTKHLQFMFEVATTEKDRRLRIFTMVMLSKALEHPHLIQFTRLVTATQVSVVRLQLERKDVLLRTEDGASWKVVEQEELNEECVLPAENCELVSNFVAKLMVLLAKGNSSVVNDELTISTVSQVLLKSDGKMTRILCSEFIFHLVAHANVILSAPVINRIQGEVFNEVGDIHVYITAAYCTSLYNQTKADISLPTEQVDFLVNLYAFKRIVLDKEDFSGWINSNILETFYVATKSGAELSEHVFHLLALVLNNTCADSEQSPDYPIVKSILAIVTTYCIKHKSQALHLPSSVAEAVENLLLESDVFDETCAGIVEKFMLAGRLVADPVVEEFAKYLWHEPKVSIPFLRRLSIANVNHELPDAIFASYQMELVGVRLYPKEICAEGETVLDHQHLSNGKGDPSTLFQCIGKYVSEGMQLSRFNLDVIFKLLQQWKGKPFRTQRESIIRCLACTATNGQSLPKNIVELSLYDDEEVDFNIQLELAVSIVRRNQEVPEKFLSTVFKKLKVNQDLTRSNSGKNALQLLQTMIHHNQHLPMEVIRMYTEMVFKHMSTMTTPDILSSFIRLLDNQQVTDEEDMRTCGNVFLFAMDTSDSTRIELGAKGLLTLPKSVLDTIPVENVAAAKQIRDSFATSLTAVPSVNDFLTAIKKFVDSSTGWQLNWPPIWREEFENLIGSDIEFLGKLEQILLNVKKACLSEFEEMIIESLCASMASTKSSEDVLLKCGRIIVTIVQERSISLSSTCLSYLGIITSNAGKNCVHTLLLPPKEDKPQKKKKGFLKRFFQNSSKEETTTDSIAMSIISRSQRSCLMPLGSDEVGILESEIIDGNLSSDLLEAYDLVITQLKTTPQMKLCIQSLAQYLNDKLETLEWTAKRYILNIFLLAAINLDQLPAPVLDVIADGVFNPNDPLLRGLCFSILRILHGNGCPQLKDDSMNDVWMSSFQANLTNFYQQVCSVVEAEDLEESDFNVKLVLALQTTTVVDVRGLTKKRDVEWIPHLLITDTILTFASTTDDELELYPIVDDLCSKLKHHPMTRLYILHAIKDYTTEHGKTLPIARLFHLISLSLTGKTTVEPWNAKWIDNAISTGFTMLLGDKLRATTSNVLQVVIERAVHTVTIQLLDKIITLVCREGGETSTSSIHEFKVLLEFLEKNRENWSVVVAHLNDLIKAKKGCSSIRIILASIQTYLLLAQIPKGAADTFDKLTKVNCYVNELLAQSYDYQLLYQLCGKIASKVKKNLTTVSQCLGILETIFHQLHVYRVKYDKFEDIYDQLMENKSSDWVMVCNNLVMSHINSDVKIGQGVKIPTDIAKEFANTNELHPVPSYMQNFHQIVKKVKDGKFKSMFDSMDSDICEWQPVDIQQWSAEVEGSSKMPQEFLDEAIAVIQEGGLKNLWMFAKNCYSELNCEEEKTKISFNNLSPEFVEEALAVISRACLINRHYHLTAIQILTIYSTIIGNKNVGRLLQVATGSGKSTIIAALVVIRSLIGSSVDVYTSSPVLAERDAKTWAPFYNLFNLSCDHNGDKGSGYTKGAKVCYNKNVVYGDTSQFQFDALRHDYSGLGTRGGRKYGFAIVDEVDSMFVDDSSKLARLSCTLPGMDLLQIVYHLMWHRLHDVQKRLFSVGTGIYYLEGARSVDENGNMYYTFADKENGGQEKCIKNLAYFIVKNQNDSKEMENALIFKVENIDDFVVEHLKNYTMALIGNYSFSENDNESQKLPLPKYLKAFAKSQVDNWVNSALTAVAFQDNVHYIVDQDQIKPVDYHTTGIVQASTNWNNGLHQFLQIKHSLKVTTETVTTNFLSNMAMFRKYGADLVGFTGTLGSRFGQEILRKEYNVDTAIIPELYYKKFQLLGEHVLGSKEQWVEKIVYSALQESSRRRAVLVICQTIKEADFIAEHLETRNSRANSTSIKLYTRNDFSQEKHVQQVSNGDIIVATNLAGRGTDINTTKVENQGGLHVILTFLPDSLRVEDQAFGRTARQGKRGTGELIVLGTNGNCAELKDLRNEDEKCRLINFQNKELSMIKTKDKLFSKFCKVYSRIRREFTSSVKEMLGMDSLSPLEHTRLQAIEQQWAIFLKKVDDGELGPEQLDKAYLEFENRIDTTYEDIDKSFNSCENCFYWIQFGNEFFRRWNIKNDNTGEAQKCFEKAIRMDSDFAAGGHAGFSFCLLKGKTHYIGSNSHVESYKTNAITRSKDALKCLYTEISLYTTVQTLLLQRGGEPVSELFNQLTEKVNLVGEYARNIEGIISTVEMSLRRVFVTEISETQELEKQWRLNDDNPKIEQFSDSRNKFRLEFHDLTFRDDCGRRDQAKETLADNKNVTITLHNQNLDTLVTAVRKKTGNKLSLIQLNGVDGIKGVTELLVQLNVRGDYALIIESVKKESLKELASLLPDMKKVGVTWQNDDVNAIRFKKFVSLDNSSSTFNDISEATDLSIEIDFQHDADLANIQPFLDEKHADLSIILKNLTENQISKGWATTNKEDSSKTMPNILQLFNRNKVTLKKLSNSDAKDVIDILRENKIAFELECENLKRDDAIKLLGNGGRVQEDIELKGLKEMGQQFSSTYIPLDIIRELVQRGLVLMPEFMEKLFVPWRSVISIGILASVQVAAGGILICTGFGATLGMGLLTEGMADFTTAYRVYSTRQFNWTDFAIQKAVSLTISAVSMGLSSLKDGAKGIQTVAQGAATEVVERAGQKAVTGAMKKTLNEMIKISGNNLKSLVVKQVAVQGAETAARIGINAAVDAVTEFSFESVKVHLSQEIETCVSRNLRHPECVQILRTCSATNTTDILMSKVLGWMNEVTNPQSGNWNKAWDSVGYPLCQGILSDPKYIGSKFSMATRLIGVINGCTEISTVTGKVCDHIWRKLDAECESITPAYVIQEQFGLSSVDSKEIASKMEFGDGSRFHVRNWPTECKVNVAQVKQVFEKLHKAIVNYKPDNEQTSRIIKSITDHLTSHITHVANRQLVSPLTTAAVGKLVASISSEIQSKYLVNDSQLSDDQIKVRELNKKDASELTAEEKSFLQQNDRPVTFAEQIRGNAKDFTVSYQKRDIIAVISTISQHEKADAKIPDKLTKESEGALGNILGGGPADITTIFLLAQLNNVDVKLVDDPNYQPTQEDKESGVNIIVWEKPADGQPIGHYAVMNPETGQTTDFIGGGINDCAYNVLHSIIGKSPDQLRLQSALFIAANQEKFGEINQSANWIRDRYPLESNTLLNVGGRQTQRKTNTDERLVVPISTKVTEDDNNDDVNEENEKLLTYRRVTIELNEGQGCAPLKDTNVKQYVKDINEVLSAENGTCTIEYTDDDGTAKRVEVSSSELQQKLGKRVVSGHMGTDKLGTRGTDNNMVPITSSLNATMSKRFEERCTVFLNEAEKQGLIKSGDVPLTQEYSMGQINNIIVGDKKLPFVESVTCSAYLNIPNGLSDVDQSRLRAIFDKALNHPPRTALYASTDHTGNQGYGATFSNTGPGTGKMQPPPPNGRHRHENEIEMESSSDVHHR